MAALRVLASVAVLLLAAPPVQAFPSKVLDSVVSVLPEWPNPAAHRERPEGSGVAILPGGYLATNGHVIGEAQRIKVRLRDGRVVPAEIVGRDPASDIALLKIALALPVLPAAPEPRLASPVCAVANQFGLGLSVTCGVVSALHRSGTGFNPVEDFIQTDASANPGSSGGALVDGEGRLVGMISAIFTKGSDADIGVNFAASRALVMRVVEDLKAHGRVKRAKLGLRVESLGQAERTEFGGARVTRIVPGGAAEKAVLKVGDIIIRIGRRAIREASDVVSAVYLHRPGARIDILVMRGGAAFEVSVELGS